MSPHGTHPDKLRFSDLIDYKSKPRADWSGLRLKLEKLQPGEVLYVGRPPAGVTTKQLRSTILVIGARLEELGLITPGWRLATKLVSKPDRRVLCCYLAPRRSEREGLLFDVE